MSHVCEDCGRACTNLKDGLCCLERNMHPYLFEKTKQCKDCNGQQENLEEKMERLKHDEEQCNDPDTHGCGLPKREIKT